MQTLIRGKHLTDCYSKMSELIEKRLNSLFSIGQTFALRYARNMEIFRGSRTGQKNLFVGDCDANDDDRHNAAVRWGGQ